MAEKSVETRDTRIPHIPQEISESNQIIGTPRFWDI